VTHPVNIEGVIRTNEAMMAAVEVFLICGASVAESSTKRALRATMIGSKIHPSLWFCTIKNCNGVENINRVVARDWLKVSDCEALRAPIER
jgi:hypothetical protein